MKSLVPIQFIFRLDDQMYQVLEIVYHPNEEFLKNKLCVNFQNTSVIVHKIEDAKFEDIKKEE